MYGNFCGPYWSDGKFQISVANPEKQSIDDLDECCKQHDQGYATNKHLNYYDTKLLSCVKKVAFDDGLDYKKLYSYIVNKAIPIQQMVRGKQNKAFKKQTPNKVQERKLAKAEKKTQTMVKKLEKEEHSRAPVNTQINSRRMRGKLTIGGPMNRPARRGNLRKSSLSVQTLNVAGADYFDVVTVATTNAVGDILKTMELHPSGIPNTRLGFFTNMYDQYRLRSISVEYYSSVGTSTPGQILGFFDPDADESDISGPQLVHKGFSGKGKAVNVWGNSDGNPIVWSWRPPQSGRDAIRYCSTIGEKRTWSYGKFLLVASSTFGTSQTIGTLRVRYQIQFITPLLENNATIYSASSYISASPSGSLPFGTGALIGNSHNNVNVSRVSGEYINIGQPGSYLIAMDFVGTGLTGIAASGTLMTVSNIDFVTSATKIMYTAILTILPANVTTNRFGVAISGTELTDCEFRVCQVPISNFVEPPLDMTSEIERKIREYFENKETDNNNNRVPPSKRSLPSSRDEQRRPF